MKEEWRICLEFPNYAVSSLGRFKRLAYVGADGRRLKEKLLSTHKALVLCVKNGRKFRLPLGRLVLLAFVGPPPSDLESLVRHLNDDRSNNLPSNLAWGTQLDNIQDAIRNGLTKHTIESKAKISEGSKRRVARERELGIKRVKPVNLTFSGRRHSDAHKEKMRRLATGKHYTAGYVWITDGISTRMVPPQAVPDGWRLGRR
jgi:hypothetical protein